MARLSDLPPVVMRTCDRCGQEYITFDVQRPPMAGELVYKELIGHVICAECWRLVKPVYLQQGPAAALAMLDHAFETAHSHSRPGQP